MSGGNQGNAHGCLVKAVIDYLAINGAWSFKVMGGGFQRPGIPDVLACLHGRTVAVECKTGSARLSPKQTIERDRLIAAGALYLECRQIEQLEDLLLAAGLVRFRLRLRMPLLVAPPRTPGRQSVAAWRHRVRTGGDDPP